ncbi:MAG TPA: GNAT family N-acetyltransferase [Candidatus Dormibacteraeota bacterium]|nr:GNAT family N-acetyltransferase [Candidatus Dormibacteraeota bacterium]
MRPGRRADLQPLMELWAADVRAGRRDSVPRESHLRHLLADMDWEARARVVDGSDGLAAAVTVTSRSTPRGVVAYLDSAGPPEISLALAGWALALSRASGAAAAEVMSARGHGHALGDLGMDMVRPWWRMDRTLAGTIPEAQRVPGYELIDGFTVMPGRWAEMHDRSFADHWHYAPRAEAELIAGKAPALCLMAVTQEGGRPAAVAMGHVEAYPHDPRPQPVGLVSSVGTVPEHRRRGLARWLTAEVLRRLRDAGARHASLYVDGWNETRAYDGYYKLGFELAFEAEVWEATFP